jgi:photosystem II stability/assembly factor-like uncharacterized protein
MKTATILTALTILGASACGSDSSSEPLNPIWTKVASPVSQDLHDATREWAVGDQGTLLKSVDDGKTWSKQALPTQANLYRVGALQKGAFNAVYAVGDGGTIVLSRDSGATWAVKHTGSEKLRAIGSFFTESSDVIAAVGNDGSGVVLLTSTDWETWTRTLVKAGATVNAAQFSFNEGLIVGDNGLILETTDKGATWSSPAGLSAPGTNAWHFISGLGPTVFGDGAVLERSRNGQVVSWQAKRDATLPDMVSEAADYAIGANKAGRQTLVHFTDPATKAFTLEDLGVSTPLAAMAYVDDGLVVVGAEGTILHRAGR